MDKRPVAPVMLSEMDYSQPKQVQAMIEKEWVQHVQPTAPVKQGHQLEFNIPAEYGLYRDLNNTTLDLQVKVTRDDGTAIANTDVVAPVNYLMAALFKSVDVRLNGTNVNHTNQLYPFRAYMETLMSSSRDVLDTRGATMGWHKDDSSAMEVIALTDTSEVKANKGFVARHGNIKGGKILHLSARPHADIFHQPYLIPDNVDIRVTFNPNDSKFALLAAKNATFKVELLNASLAVATKRGADEVVGAHKQASESSDSVGHIIDMTKVLMNMHDISGSVVEIGSLVPGNVIPKRIALALVETAAIGGSYEKNPFKFGNAKMTSLKVVAGGDSYPRDALQMDYASGNYTKAYLSTLRSLELDTGNRALPITPSEWAEGYNLHVIKLQPGPLDVEALGWSHKTGTCTANLSFSEAVTGYSLIVYAEVPSVIHISPSGAVTQV